jgi:serine/threonine-protein kinase
MTLSPGTRLGSYEVVAPLGAGAMGQVYRATDTRLGRDVALKTLPDTFNGDPERLARFRREAQVLASLNHPHIAAIYGIEEAAGQQVLVLEFVDGETLAHRLTRGPIAVEEVLVAARQIAEALEAAHDKGIVHRDLKPANIALTGDGTVKVLDFGLAKATEAAGPTHVSATQSPTLTAPALTGVGVILGTAAYMSPEQARGRAADRRSDVWAFGCVVYEMLTGRRAFPGDEISDTLAGVLRDEPDWQALPPAAWCYRNLLRRTLEKDPKRRLRDIGDVKLLMEDPAPASAAVPSNAGRFRRGWIAGAAALGVIAGVTATALVFSSRATPPVQRLERFTLTSAVSTVVAGGNVAISPSGSHIVYTSAYGMSGRLVIRSIDRIEEMPIPGTERVRDPFFSPDGRQIGFATMDELRRIPIDGGNSSRICRVSFVFGGGSWGPDDSIVFAQGGGQGLFRVRAGGGEPELLAAPDVSKGERDYSRPTFLPDGRSILYTVGMSGGENRIAVRRLDGGDARMVAESGFGAQYLASGHLLYGQGNRLMAMPFDAEAARATGPGVPVYEDLSTKVVSGISNIATAADGTVIFVSGGLGQGPRHVVWVDRSGSASPALDRTLNFPRYPRLSPDGHRLAITTGPAIEGHIWIYDLGRRDQPGIKLTHQEHNLFPIWSADAKQIVFLRRGRTNLLLSVSADGRSLEPETLATNDDPLAPMDWVRLSDSFLFRQAGPQTRESLLEMRMVDRQVRTWLLTPWNENEARISPDGKWVAYTSERAGTTDVWVSPYDDPKAAVRVSADGGRDPVWAHKGHDLFYRNGSKLMAARLVPAGREIGVEERRELFDGGFESASARAFDVAPDGRFLMIAADERDSSASIVLVRNWASQLKDTARSR